jgi:hypothetical protein
VIKSFEGVARHWYWWPSKEEWVAKIEAQLAIADIQLSLKNTK